MRRNCPQLQELRNEVIAGTITGADIEKRLSAAIEEEYLKPQPSAEFINLCEDLLWHIGTQGKQPLPSSTDRYLELIERHTKPGYPVRTGSTMIKRLAVVLTLFVLIVALSGGVIYFRWFTQSSSPDEQQHVIMGHEITVEMVASAIADNTVKEPIVVSDFSKFEKHLGFDPGIPSVLGDEWVADYGAIHFVSGYVKITAQYVNRQDENQRITCLVNYYDDIEYAYISFEQTAEGNKATIHGVEMYLSNNIERNSAIWYNYCMYAKVTGDITSDEAATLLLNLLGEDCE